MRYKIILNSILLIYLLVMIESCMTSTQVPSNEVEPNTQNTKEPKNPSHPEEPPPIVEVSFFYSQDGGTSLKTLTNDSQLYSRDGLRIEVKPQKNTFIQILLVNNSTGSMQKLDRPYGLTELTGGIIHRFPKNGLIILDKTKANGTLCVFAYKKLKEGKANSNCNHSNVVKKVSFKLN